MLYRVTMNGISLKVKKLNWATMIFNKGDVVSSTEVDVESKAEGLEAMGEQEVLNEEIVKDECVTEDAPAKNEEPRKNNTTKRRPLVNVAPPTDSIENA